MTALLSSCTTTGSDVTSRTIKEHNQSYQAKGTASVPNDIKKILIAGGLDVTDPSSPAATTSLAELKKIPDRNQKEVDALVASLSAKSVNQPEIKTASSPDTTQTASIQKTKEKTVVDKTTPTQSLAFVAPHDTVDEERYKFPDIGPNLKPGQQINTETAVIVPPPETSTSVEVVATPQQIQNVGKPIKKSPRSINSDIVYAKPSVQRF